MAPNCPKSHCIDATRHSKLKQAKKKKKKKTVPLTDVLGEAVEFHSFIKTKPLSTCIFNILCDRMGNTHKAFMFHIEVP